MSNLFLKWNILGPIENTYGDNIEDGESYDDDIARYSVTLSPLVIDEDDVAQL